MDTQRCSSEQRGHVGGHGDTPVVVCVHGRRVRDVEGEREKLVT